MTTTLTYQGKKITYDIHGSGNPVIFIHGFGEDRDVWRNQIPFLENKCRLIVPDLPGSGASEFNEQLTTVEAYAEAIKAILDNESVNICTMLGHSMGGYITLAFAEKFPGMLNGFGLVHSTALPDSEEKKAARKKSIGFIESNGSLAFLKTSTPGLFSEAWAEENPAEIEALIERGQHFLPAALVQYYTAMIARPDRTHLLLESSVPVLFLAGQHDNAIPFDSVMKQVSLPNLSQVHILRESGHMGMWEEAAATNEAIAGFLALV